MTFLLLAFLASAALLWLSSFGYALTLHLARGRRPPARHPAVDSARVTLVVPTLDEEGWIDGKLENLRHLDYPADRLDVVVVDGGSVDGTIARVRERIARGEAIRLIEMKGRGGKAAQINRVLAGVEDGIVVLTDADTELDPTCVGLLVGHLEAEPGTGVASALVSPRTGLVEERVHWALLNWIWWLEGEVWSAAGLSGVCYALRPSAFRGFARRPATEDVHLALGVRERGFRVRICPQARVRELRVPGTIAEFLSFRRRRGGDYLAELAASASEGVSRRGWRATQWVRRWQMQALPGLAVVATLLALPLLASPYWRWPLAVGVGLGLSAAWALLRVRGLPWNAERIAGPRWAWAAVRYAFMTLASLLLVVARPQVRSAEEGERWSAAASSESPPE